MEGPGGRGQRQLPVHGRRTGVPAGRQRRGGGRVPRSLRARAGRGSPPLPAGPTPRRRRRRVRRPAAAGVRGLRGSPGFGPPRPPAARLVTRRPLRRLHRRHHRRPEGRALAPGRLPGHRIGHHRRSGRARAPGRGLRSPPRAPGATVHARRRPLERHLVLARRRDGRDPVPHRPTRRRRRAGHLRARAGGIAPDRRRRLRPAAARRDPASPTGSGIAPVPDDRRRGPVTSHQASAPRRGPRIADRRHPRVLGDRPPRPEPGVIGRCGRAGRVRAVGNHRRARRRPRRAAGAGFRCLRLAGAARSGAARLPRRPSEDRGHVPPDRRRHLRGGRRSGQVASGRHDRAARPRLRHDQHRG